MTLSALDALPGTTLKAPAAAKTSEQAAKAAQKFEASFLSIMMGQLFEGTEISAPFGGGQGEAAFKSFLTEEMGKAMARHGGIGIARQVQAELMKLQGAGA